MGSLYFIAVILRALLMCRGGLVAENLALRQQLAVLNRASKCPRLRRRDRVFWVWLSRFWTGWRSSLLIVQPATVIKWHRQGFKLYWRWKSGKPGRPRIDPEIRKLNRRMSLENPLWGAPRVQSELRLLGHEVAESTVAKYMARKSTRPPSQSWRTFLKNHLGCTAACDFFVVPTVTFRLLYCFVVLAHDRRRIVHFSVTPHPTERWTTQQLVEAFPADGTEPKYLIRDRDSTYGKYIRHRVKSMGIQEVLTAPRSPWQNPYCERVIGSIRRECLDHLIVLNERHLRRIVLSYLDYYHGSRAHQSLNHNSPIPRTVEPPNTGSVVAIPMVGGLHHRYTRAA